MTSAMAIARHNASVRAIEKEYARLVETITPKRPVRMVTKIRQRFLLRETDSMYYGGNLYHMKWRNLGSGIWEASLEEVR